jgi:hypothetical protein
MSRLSSRVNKLRPASVAWLIVSAKRSLISIRAFDEALHPIPANQSWNHTGALSNHYVFTQPGSLRLSPHSPCTLRSHCDDPPRARCALGGVSGNLRSPAFELLPPSRSPISLSASSIAAFATCFGSFAPRSLTPRDGCAPTPDRWPTGQNGPRGEIIGSITPSVCLAQFQRKIANAEASQDRLDLVPDPHLLGDETAALAARPFGTLLFDRRDRDHAAVTLLAAQPAEQDAQQQFGIKAIRLCASMFARQRS